MEEKDALVKKDIKKFDYTKLRLPMIICVSLKKKNKLIESLIKKNNLKTNKK